MKKILIVLILAAALLMLSSCGDGQRVRITNHSVIMDNVVLAIRNGYQLAEDSYSITEYDDGYDIVIHIKKEK